MIQLFSPAKINLFFKIMGLRKDGYHNIQSFFQAIDLGDIITIQKSLKDVFISNDTSLQLNSKNFIYQALTLFRQTTQHNEPVSISLNKHIPMGAGLGGGSSNAATMLWGLNLLFDTQIHLEQLKELASQISSDAPFFFSKGSAFCEGRGEKIYNQPTPMEPSSMWLVQPPFAMSTPEVYLYTHKISKISLSAQELTQSLYTSSPKHYNDLEEAAFRLNPRLALLKDELEYQGMSQVFMTGSGSGLICMGKEAPRLKKPVQIFPIQYINRTHLEWYTEGSYATQ